LHQQHHVASLFGMTLERREFVVGMAVAVGGCAAPRISRKNVDMYGLIGTMTAKSGQRGVLADILLNGISGMPGCLSYIVASDPANADLIWITEVWESKEAHAASLSLASVKEAIAKGRPLIAGMASVAETSPIGGQGLPKSR
jgi:quinol monooxygenase YgiN